MRIKNLISYSVILVILGGITSCKNTASMEGANRAYSLYQFNTAISIYKKVAKKEKNKRRKREAYFKMGECYRRMNSYSNAEKFYDKAVKMKYPDPIALYDVADMKRRQEKFEDALIEFNNYLKEVPADPKGKEGVESCERALKWKTEYTRYVVDNFKILNSKYNDFAPMYYKNGAMIFSSDREESNGKEKYDWTGQQHLDIYISEPQKGRKTTKLQKPTSFDPDDIVNTRYNDGAACFDKKMTTMYYTQCNGKKGKEPNCRIFKVSKKGQVWDEPEMLPFCNDSAANYGHPSLSPDGKKLYFSSNMKGGYGGHDIWVSTLVSKGKTWSDPVNLGPVINTPGEELYPFIYSDNKTLYFSSDGHPGIGGLDIFYSVKNDTGGWSKPVNLKMPINSGSDDFSIIVEPGGTKTKGYKGFFASDRPESRGDDIYEFYMTPLKFNLAGTVFNDKTKEVVPDATVSLQINDTQTISTTTDKSGYYKFPLGPDSKYKVSATKKMFFDSHEDSVSTVGLEFSQDFVRDLYLYPYLDTTFELEGIYYGLDSADLRPAAKRVLDSLYTILVKHPYIVIEIGSHTDCRASYDYNIDLSNRRAQSVVDYLIYKGIPMDRMVPHGYGESDPVNNCRCENNEGPGMNCTEAEHQQNRRTTFKVLRTDYVYGQGQEPPKEDNEKNKKEKEKKAKNINKPVIPNQNQQNDNQNNEQLNQENQQNNASDSTKVIKPVKRIIKRKPIPPTQ